MCILFAIAPLRRSTVHRNLQAPALQAQNGQLSRPRLQEWTLVQSWRHERKQECKVCADQPSLPENRPSVHAKQAASC